MKKNLQDQNKSTSLDQLIINLSNFTVCALGIDAFTWQPVTHNVTTTGSTNTTTKPNATTPTIPTTTPKFTWGPLHNATTPEPTPSSTEPKSTFTWPNIHTTTASGISGSDLIPIIVGAALGGLVVIVLASYIIVQYRSKKKREELEEN